MKAEANRQTLYFLQVLRGLAALLVVCYHGTLVLRNYYGIDVLGGDFYWGFSGVPLFFVLSGFIIFFIHVRDINKPHQSRAFLFKRFIRIYPTYWLVLLLSIPYIALSHHSIYWPHLLQNITLLKLSHFEMYVPVAWTLCHEVLFYLVFLLLIINRSLGIAICAIWGSCIAYQEVLHSTINPPYIMSVVTNVDYGVFTSYTLLFSSPLNALFAVGAVSFLVYSKKKSNAAHERLAIVSLVIGVIIFIGASIDWVYVVGKGHDPNNSFPYYGIFGIGAAFLMIASGSHSIELWASRRRLLLLLGDASYSIYLIHLGLQHLIFPYLRDGLGLHHITLSFWILVLVAACVGVMFHLIIEKPLLAAIRHSASLKGKVAISSP